MAHSIRHRVSLNFLDAKRIIGRKPYTVIQEIYPTTFYLLFIRPFIFNVYLTLSVVPFVYMHATFSRLTGDYYIIILI